MITVSRSRRGVIRKTAVQIRMHALATGLTTEQTAQTIRTDLPEVGPLEAWRLALGWSRAASITRVGALYRSKGLLPPGMSQSMLCRWEHQSDAWPGDEYTEALCEVYQARPDQLGLDRRNTVVSPAGGYSARAVEACSTPVWEGIPTMTTAAGLPAVRESLHLALLIEPAGSSTVADLADAAVEHYALGYSTHPPSVLFDEIHQVRGLLTHALTTAATTAPIAVDLQRSLGWLSALLGNLAYHLGDRTGARAHLATALALGDRCGDNRLAGWACGAQAMVARAGNQHTLALEHAERGLAYVTSGLPRAQLHAWAQLPSLAALGRSQDADRAFADATRALEADSAGFAAGRFGYDEGEHRLHEAEAHRALARTDKAAATAELSLNACVLGTPAWAAASLVLAQAEAPARPDDAAQRALAVLDRIPAARLRSTSRSRLAELGGVLAAVDSAAPADLCERVRLLPPPIDAHGSAAKAG